MSKCDILCTDHPP